MNPGKKLYDIYRRTNDSRVISSAIFYAYRMLSYIKSKNNRPCKCHHPKPETVKNVTAKEISQITIAIICDDMTYESFRAECRLVFLTPNNWLEVIQREKPDLFFCESAWSGIHQYQDCWRGRIYKNERLLFENRKVLFEILSYCKQAQIKTVFWNKEDPVYFNQQKYNFSDTAKHFDVVLTTASECVPEYRKLGCRRVFTWMFGFSPVLYHPDDSVIKENTAVFAGSWYTEQPERCKDMKELFDMVLAAGIKLVIYDRNYGNNSYQKRYPEKYQPYVHPSIPYNELAKVYQRSKYAININTVKDSETMFARRVFEIMACNTTVISNESLGMKERFGDSVWFTKESCQPERYIEGNRENLKQVMSCHTNRKRLLTLLDLMEIAYIEN